MSTKPNLQMAVATRGAPDAATGHWSAADTTVRTDISIGIDSDSCGDVIRMAKVLIAHDAPEKASQLCDQLKSIGFENLATASANRSVIQIMRDSSPDVVLLDETEPGVRRLEILCQRIDDPQLSRIPILVFTTSDDTEMKSTALKLGVSDFLSKPIDEYELVLRVRNTLHLKVHQDHAAHHADLLERKVRWRTEELVATRREVFHCLARASEYRDDDTGHHVIRVGRYAGIIGRELGFNESRVELFELAAQLHDVGKIGVPDSILLNPGRLATGEFEIMKEHCDIGRRIIEPFTENELPTDESEDTAQQNEMRVFTSPLLMLASMIAQTHHEKWDGSGYPLGLAGEEIPIEGRITAVADVFDALSTKRPYKPAFPVKKCFRIIEEGRGGQFDPQVVDAFFAREHDIIEVQKQYKDFR